MSTVDTEPHPDDVPERPGRRRLVTAMVAVAVLLVGGGAVVAAGQGGPSGGAKPDVAAVGEPDPLELEGYPEAAAASVPTFRAEGELPRGPQRATVYRPTGQVDKETVTELARSLGITAEPEREHGSWVAADGTDGTGPALRVRERDGGAWSFVHYTPQGDDKGGLKGEEVPSHDGTATSPGRAPAAPITPPVSPEEAKEIAAPVLEAAGLGEARTEAAGTRGALRLVEADPVLEEVPTDAWRTTVSVGADGRVVRAEGHLATVRAGTTYPVLGAEETLRVMSERGVPVAVHCVTTPCPAQRMEPSAGQDELVVTDAEFVLAARHSRGEPVLVPSWRFELADDGGARGRAVTFPALEPVDITVAAGGEGSPGAPGDPGEPTGVPAPGERPDPRPSAPPTTDPMPPAPPKGDGGQEPGFVPPADPDVEPPHMGMTVEGYSASDRELTLHFMGGVCGVYAAEAAETADRVRVTVAATPAEPGQPCILVAKETSVTVPLEEPVGERTVVDAGGRTIPRR
ncbi:hypothetical protein [Streptomyces sp. JJ38]|uniref:hypothetical protein n=1 Tax=Streptomyces sp. JJ38 TaxID=2738128 RepID=UPI001C569729|nr:hypothetical protein [Streptomyces sp. JJ38]MBW1599180.1 hypothetical protein [Streptomyces sp. JJ38]